MRDRPAPDDELGAALQTVMAASAHLVRRHLGGDPGTGGFDGFLARHPGLSDPGLLGRHWTAETLYSPAARGASVGPDRHPIPV